MKSNPDRLTHINLVFSLWDIGKQCKPRSDIAWCGVHYTDQDLHRFLAEDLLIYNIEVSEYHPIPLKL